MNISTSLIFSKTVVILISGYFFNKISTNLETFSASFVLLLGVFQRGNLKIEIEDNKVKLVSA